MWLLIKTAWRNLFRQRRRTVITVSAMALSLWLAIPTWGLTEGLTQEMLRGITGMELGHLQLHDPAYPKGKALQSTLDRPDHLLKLIRATPGVVAAAPRVHGYALASHDERLHVRLVGLAQGASASGGPVQFGRPIDPRAPWHKDPALACEALVSRAAAARAAVVVGTVLTPGKRGAGGRCERIQVVGLLRDPLAPGPGPLVIGLREQDLVSAFGQRRLALRAVVRHSAAIALMGVEPEAERRVTFMAEKVVEGRYLGPKPRNEIVVGFRLARTMHLKVGDKIFVQAAALDNTKGTFYQDFEVVGIYRTGVDMLDRARVFIHVQDAQKIMTLGNRVHEIAVTGTDARRPQPLVVRLRSRVTTRLRITSAAEGQRAGSQPLPAPVTVYEPRNGDTALLIPYDLKRRFEDLEGVQAVAKRVYGRTGVAPATRLSLSVARQAAPALRRAVGAGFREGDRCRLYVAAPLAAARGLKAGDVLVPWGAATSGDGGCGRVTVALVAAAAPSPGKTPPGAASLPGGATVQAPAPATDALVLAPSGGEDDDEATGLAAGAQGFLRLGGQRSLRLVGVEPGYERTLSGLDRQLGGGTYFALRGAAAAAPDTEAWPALVSERVAKALGIGPGALLAVDVKDEEGRARIHAARLIGVLKDATWPAARPELVLPYYPAQAVDSRRLNAKAHEILLVPKAGADPRALAKAAAKRLKPLIRPWQAIQPDMAKLIQTQDLWVGIMLFIIFAIAAMTVMNTMLMAVWERTREFGVLKSLGMRPVQVFGLIVFETIFLSVLAAIVGGGGGVALNHWAVVSGIDLSAWTGGFTYQGTFINPVWRAAHTVKAIAVPIVMVQLVCLLVSFYPAMRAGRLKPVVALRHNG